MKREYAIYDVFTATPLAGNPLAIVFDAEGLDTSAMQKIAGEFNLSETVFVLPAVDPVFTAQLRIFTPGAELPFAGHPTVGTAIALAQRKLGQGGIGDAIIMLEEKIGPVRCGVNISAEKAFAEFDLPKPPQEIGAAPEASQLAAALSLSKSDIGFENHVPTVFSAGVPMTFVPLRNIDAAKRAKVNSSEWDEVFAGAIGGPEVYIYCRECVQHQNHFHARMFAPSLGIAEDPATGSAVASFAGVIVKFDQPLDGLHKYSVEQGVEMGRPSRIDLEIEVKTKSFSSGRIGGNAVKIAEGFLEL